MLTNEVEYVNVQESMCSLNNEKTMLHELECPSDSEDESIENMKRKPRKALLQSSDDEDYAFQPSTDVNFGNNFISDNLNTVTNNSEDTCILKSINGDSEQTIVTCIKRDSGHVQCVEKHGDDSENLINVTKEVPSQTAAKKSGKGKKATEDSKLTIRSETQRMEREMAITLPYHRPKQRSLREFLARKKSHIKAESLRLMSTDMIQTWQEIDRSIHEVTEFFKSESEDEADCDPTTPCTEDQNELHQQLETESASKCNGFQNRGNDDDRSESIFIETGDKYDLNRIQTITSDSPARIYPECVTDSVVVNDSDGAVPKKDSVDLSEKKVGKWLEDIVTHEVQELGNKLQLNSTMVNKDLLLSNNSSEFVDLDNTEPSELKPGAKQLMQRFLKGRQQQNPNPASLTTTMAERDVLGNIVKLHVETIVLNSKSKVIGAKLPQLREKLRNDIEAKWEKKHKDKCLDSSEKCGFEPKVVCDEPTTEDDGESEVSVEESENDSSEDEIEVKEKPRIRCAFGDSEAEESADEGDDEDSDNELEDCENEDSNDAKKKQIKPGCSQKSLVEDNNSDDMECSLLPAFQPGGGLLLGGSILTQQTQPLPRGVFSPNSSPTISQLGNCRTPDLAGNLTGSNKKPHITKTSPNHSGSPGVKKNLFGYDGPSEDAEADNVDDPFLFVSGTFMKSPVPVPEPTSTQVKPKRIILPEDSEDSRSCKNGENEEETQPQCLETMLLKFDDGEDIQTFIKKKKKILTFSDDEDDDGKLDGTMLDRSLVDTTEKNSEDNEKADADEREESHVGDEEVPSNADDVDYDSEENEVRPTEFFEKEAELSESEWSGDEDERGLDTLEAEAGDADVLDEDQVASQLGRIHMRRILDADAREVRLLQEILFEDGDLHTDGKERDRKFRWKNLAGFDLEYERGGGEADDGSDAEVDDTNIELAKLRRERNKFFMKLEEEGKKIIEEPFLQFGQQILQRLQPRPVTSTITKPSRARGSFLQKDEGFLSRLARVTGSGQDAPLGPANSSNFVFAVKEREISAEGSSKSLKRKAVECQKAEKKKKLLNELPLLDQL